MDRDHHHRKLERMYLAAPTNEYFAPRIHITDGEAQINIPVRPDFFHTAGAVHGAVYFKALDDAAFFAVNSRVNDVFVLTAGFHVDLVRPVVSGELVARGRVVHESRRQFLAEAELWDQEERLLGRGHGSFMPSAIALTPDVGYR